MPTPKKEMAPHTLRKVKVMYEEENKTILQISNTIAGGKFSPSTLRNRMIEAGIKIRSEKRGSRLPQKVEDEIIFLYSNTEMPVKDIASVVGVDTSTVTVVRKRNCVPARSRSISGRLAYLKSSGDK